MKSIRSVEMLKYLNNHIDCGNGLYLAWRLAVHLRFTRQSKLSGLVTPLRQFSLLAGTTPPIGWVENSRKLVLLTHGALQQKAL